jgi:AcrR family transcriptional regulator
VRVNTHKHTLHGHLRESSLIKLDPTDSVQAGLEDPAGGGNVVARKPAGSQRVSHADQKLRTRTALVDACRQLIRSGGEVTMPVVARAAGVSEATAYRHFADLVSLINEALAGLWPTPAQALAPVAASADPVARIGFACEFLLRGVTRYQGAVRAAIAATISRPASVASRPGIRFGLIDQALDPVVTATGSAAERILQLKQDLAAVVSAEAFFSLTDLCRLSADDAIASLVRTARAITEAALREFDAPER